MSQVRRLSARASPRAGPGRALDSSRPILGFARSAGEAKFVAFHVHAPSLEGNAFGLQAEPLLEPGFPTQLDMPAGAQNPVPGKAVGAVKNSHHLAHRPRIARGPSNGSVRRNAAARDSTDGDPDLVFHRTRHWGLIILGTQ